MRQILIALTCGILLAGEAYAASRADVERQFQQWIATDLWQGAKKLGVSKKTLQTAFAGVTLNWKLPDLVPPGTKAKTPRKQRQAEFGSPGNYFSQKTLGSIAASGRSLAKKHASTLKMVEKKYGVPAHIILAIWGRESGFGRVKIPYNAFRVLGTKAFMSTRRELFHRELLGALVMVERGHVSAKSMKSSWAGALGQPQFLPTSYLNHAADGDGDGRSDIWRSDADTLASIANYLKNYGWVSGRDWGFEVTVPDTVSCALEGPDQGRKISKWAAMGIKRVSGKPFPDHEARAEGYLLMPAGRHGPAFIVTPNFYVLKEYNESDLYALFIGHSGDKIAYGSRPFSGRWGKVGGLYRSDIAAMQRILEAKGYDVGGADGLPGFKTRRSIGDWQQKNNRAPTCFPDHKLVKAIK
ncbi:MAG: lytic murein transglycosylase [Rhizobiaceae bacterium]